MLKVCRHSLVASNKVSCILLERQILKNDNLHSLKVKSFFNNERSTNIKSQSASFRLQMSNFVRKKQSDQATAATYLVSSNTLDDGTLKEFTKGETKLLRLPKIYASLSKWYLSLFVVLTTDAGFCLAPTVFDHYTFFMATVGTTLCSCSANTFNQILEVPYDAQMDRTKNRPLVRGSISTLHALGFAFASGLTGVSCLYFGTNTLTASLGLANILLYAAVYTPLKRRHWINTWMGAVVGAIPPVMGWTAATGHLDSGALIFAGILYAWQFPHFYALAWRRRGDYARGSYHMLPLSNPAATRYAVLAHSVYLSFLCLLAPITGITSMSFVYMSMPINAWMLYSTLLFFKHKNSKTAQSLYKTSLFYILLISLALIVDRKLILDDLKANQDFKLMVSRV